LWQYAISQGCEQGLTLLRAFQIGSTWFAKTIRNSTPKKGTFLAQGRVSFVADYLAVLVCHTL
jgi:hypothetical protein